MRPTTARPVNRAPEIDARKLRLREQARVEHRAPTSELDGGECRQHERRRDEQQKCRGVGPAVAGLDESCGKERHAGAERRDPRKIELAVGPHV